MTPQNQINPEEWFKEGTAKCIADLRAQVNTLETELAKVGTLVSDPSINARESLTSLAWNPTNRFEEAVKRKTGEYCDLCRSIENMYNFLIYRQQNTATPTNTE